MPRLTTHPLIYPHAAFLDVLWSDTKACALCSTDAGARGSRRARLQPCGCRDRGWALDRTCSARSAAACSSAPARRAAFHGDGVFLEGEGLPTVEGPSAMWPRCNLAGSPDRRQRRWVLGCSLLRSRLNSRERRRRTRCGALHRTTDRWLIARLVAYTAATKLASVERAGMARFAIAKPRVYEPFGWQVQTCLATTTIS